MIDHINNIGKAEILYNNLFLFDSTDKNKYFRSYKCYIQKELCFNFSFNNIGIKINEIPDLWKYSLTFRYLLSDFIIRNINHKQIKELRFSDLNGIIMNGKYFKYLFPNQMYKCINQNMVNKEFEFQIGLNIDTNEFNPINKDSKGGFHFTDEENIQVLIYFVEILHGKFIFLMMPY